MAGKIVKKGKQTSDKVETDASEVKTDAREVESGARDVENDARDEDEQTSELDSEVMDDEMDTDGFKKVMSRKARKKLFPKKTGNSSSDGDLAEGKPPATFEGFDGGRSQSQSSMPKKEITKLFFPSGAGKTYEEMVEWALCLQGELSLNELRLHIGNRVPYFTTTCPDIARKLTSEERNGIKLCRPETGEKYTKILIKDYPPVMPVDWVERHPNIKWAKRRMKGHQKQWQVIACWIGELPADKVSFAPIIAPCAIVKYIESPKICAKCNQWNHFKAQCKSPGYTCGVCAGRHDTNICMEKLASDKNADKPILKCPGCKGPHKAWYWKCPKRPMWDGFKIQEKSNPNNEMRLVERSKVWGNPNNEMRLVERSKVWGSEPNNEMRLVERSKVGARSKVWGSEPNNEVHSVKRSQVGENDQVIQSDHGKENGAVAMERNANINETEKDGEIGEIRRELKLLRGIIENLSTKIQGLSKIRNESSNKVQDREPESCVTMELQSSNKVQNREPESSVTMDLQSSNQNQNQNSAFFSDCDTINRKEMIEGVVSARNVTVAKLTKVLNLMEQDESDGIREEIKTFSYISKKLSGYIDKIDDTEYRNNGAA